MTRRRTIRISNPRRKTRSNAWFQDLLEKGSRTTYRRRPEQEKEFEGYSTPHSFGYRRRTKTSTSAPAPRTKAKGEELDLDVLNSIARSQGAKSFKSLSKEEKDLVRGLAGRMKNPPFRSTAKSALSLYDKGVSTAYNWTAGLPSRLAHSLLENPSFKDKKQALEKAIKVIDKTMDEQDYGSPEWIRLNDKQGDLVQQLEDLEDLEKECGECRDKCREENPPTGRFDVRGYGRVGRMQHGRSRSRHHWSIVEWNDSEIEGTGQRYPGKIGYELVPGLPSFKTKREAEEFLSHWASGREPADNPAAGPKHQHYCPVCRKKRFCTDPTCTEIDYSWMCDQCDEDNQELEEDEYPVKLVKKNHAGCGCDHDNPVDFNLALFSSKDKAVTFAKKKLSSGYRWAEIHKSREKKHRGKYRVEYGTSTYMPEGLNMRPLGEDSYAEDRISNPKRASGRYLPPGTKVIINDSWTINGAATIVKWGQTVHPLYKTPETALVRMERSGNEREVPLHTISLPEGEKGWPKGSSYRPNRRRNPETSADDMFESFHGYPPEHDTIIEDEEHYHENLAALGDLRSLEIITPTNLKVEIGFETGKGVGMPILASNEEGTQLFIEGGDQSIDLKSLKMDGDKWLKEHMVLGDIETITYDTEKTFDDREPVSYYHHFTEDEPKGPLPELIYDTVNQKLSIVGGKYFIKQPLIGVSPGIEN